MNKNQLLSLLYQQEGNYISGESMSQTLGVSRSAIWKQISQLREAGYLIESAPHKGYCLRSNPLQVESVKLAQILGDAPLGSTLIYTPTIDSTNTEVKRLASQNAPHGLLVIANEQTAGRGRQGRSFHSPSGQGLYLSLLLRPQLPHSDITNITAWVAVALCRGISQCCGVDLGIKWVNDLVWGNKKVCGILTELTLESETNFVEYVVIGIGINLRQSLEDFPEELRDTAISLETILGKSVNSTALCGAILKELNQMYSSFPQEKNSYLEEYRKLCITLDKDIQVLKGDSRRHAKALDIDNDFCLVVRYNPQETEHLSSGEVSVRGMYGYL